MILLLKFLLQAIVVYGANIGIAFLLESKNLLSFWVGLSMIVEIIALQCIIFWVSVANPIRKIQSAIKVIDFNKDVIDFSRVDTLKIGGFKEIKMLLEKYKYFLDIVSERISAINVYTYKSEHDGLTGCYNRVRLDSVQNNYELQKNFCVIFIDVNNLKRMNDECGHSAGDLLLLSAAEKLKFWEKYGDVYRMGGDEFMIVLTNVSQDKVMAMIKKWYPAVGYLNTNIEEFKCVLSYGVAFGSHNDDFDVVQKEADEAMYEMKVAIKKKFGEPMR